MKLWKKFIFLMIAIALLVGMAFYTVYHVQAQRSETRAKAQNIQLMKSAESSINDALGHWVHHFGVLVSSNAMQAYLVALQNNSLVQHPRLKTTLEHQFLIINNMTPSATTLRFIGKDGQEKILIQHQKLTPNSKHQLETRAFFKEAVDKPMSLQVHLPSTENGDPHVILLSQSLWLKGVFLGVLNMRIDIAPTLGKLKQSIPVGIADHFYFVTPKSVLLFSDSEHQRIIDVLLKNSQSFKKAIIKVPSRKGHEHLKHHHISQMIPDSSVEILKINDHFVSVVPVPFLQASLILITYKATIDKNITAIALDIIWISFGSIVIIFIFGTSFVRKLMVTLNETLVSKKYVDRIIKSVANMLFTLDEDLNIQLLNDAAKSTLGYREDELLGRSFELLLSSEYQVENKRLVSQLAKHPVSNIDRVLIAKGGREIPVLFSSSIFFDKALGKKTIICIAQNIGSQKIAEKKLQYLAHYDILTKVPNRAQFDEVLQREFARCKHHNRLFALLIMDINRFKAINDRLGHPAGDKLLKRVAQKTKDSIRVEDFVSRIGGDEFAVILTEIASPYSASICAKKIINAVSSIKEIEGRDLFVEVSIGVSIFDPSEIETYEELIKNADVALYHAKEKGGSNFQYFSSTLNEQYISKLALEHDLHVALEENQFHLDYQPKIDLQTKKITGMEALIRWDHPERGTLMPGEFIHIAEDTGLIIPIGLWVLETACKEYARWQAEVGGDCGIISINVSPMQLIHETGKTLPLELKRILDATGVPIDKLELEITETAIMMYLEGAESILKELSKMGVNLSIDDFGTGYSALSNLKSLSINTVKIDKVFIDNVLKNKDDATIVQSIIALAAKLDLKVIAEGVEELSQVDFLTASGCPQAQGYYFSKPTSKENILRMIKEK